MVTRAQDLVIRIDGERPLSAESVAALVAACDRVEDHGGQGPLVVRVSGAPQGSWTRDISIALVSKWERALRRLERLRVPSIAVAVGDCGGVALDALLATDYRIATAAVRLLIPVADGATWPGMAVYRLANQAGAAAIRRAVLFGTPIDAAKSLDLWLIDEVADDPERALAASAAMAGALSGPELSIRRQLILDAAAASFEDALGAHLAACDRALRRVSARAVP